MSAKQVRKVIKRHRRLFRECPRADLLRSLVEEQLNVVSLFPSQLDAARSELIRAGMGYCVAKCGGCALTDVWSPPK